MAFTAGSPELAKAVKLAGQLSALQQTFGSTNFSGTTAALVVEDYAQKLGFGITGLTTGAGFPPFGSVLQSLGLGVAAALQNPRGETMANGITLGAVAGATVGIYMHKFIRTGEDYRATINSGVTLALGYTSGGGNTFWARGPISVGTNDTVTFYNASYKVVGFTSAGVGGTAAFRVLGTVVSTYATGEAFDVSTVGVTRGTSGVAGRTFESFPSPGGGAGFTACVFFGGAAGSTGTVS
jgi:hypothetical protein